MNESIIEGSTDVANTKGDFGILDIGSSWWTVVGDFFFLYFGGLSLFSF